MHRNERQKNKKPVFLGGYTGFLDFLDFLELTLGDRGIHIMRLTN
jgi:hypothetical protein